MKRETLESNSDVRVTTKDYGELRRKVVVPPGKVALIYVGDGEGDEFGRVVRVIGEDELFESGEAVGIGFEENENFGAGFEFALPPVVGFDFREEVGAGDEAGFESSTGKGARGFQLRGSDEDDEAAARPCPAPTRWREGGGKVADRFAGDGLI
jgi:hypothetical protein